MKKRLFHIVSLLVLAVALTSLSGLMTTVAAMVPAAVADACCAADATEGGDGGGFCPTPDCTCAHCVSLDLPAQTQLPVALSLESPFHPSPYPFRLTDLAITIDYPPESR